MPGTSKQSMWNLSRLWLRLQTLPQACSGNMSVLFGFMLIPVLGLAGVAVDHSRAISARQALQMAADAAVLASRQGGLKDEAAIIDQTRAFFQQNAQKLHDAVLKDVAVTLSGNSVEVLARAEMPATLTAVLGQTMFEIVAKSKAAAAAEDVEIALVLDNTGSMRDYMDDLKTGARDLVEAVYNASSNPSKVKVAVVPYVGAVNIGRGPTQMAWMDTTADAGWHASHLEQWAFGYEPGCVTGGGGGGGPGPGVGTTGSLDGRLPTLASLGHWLLGIGDARAASASDVPSPFIFGAPCYILNPAKINLFDLFARIPNAEWKGCVMARAEPYDVDDTPPGDGDANTKFVPWLWPDQPDAAAIAAQGGGWISANDYLPDRLDLTPAPFNDGWFGWAHWTTLKYNNTVALIDEVGPDTLGPNKSCPDPILPLTNSKSDVTDAIDRMTHWNGSGTNVAEGLAWGWRVLSPGEPFTEGAPYGKIRKIMVLMTDGVNNIDPSPDGSISSDFSAYGYLGNRSPFSFDGFRQFTDARMELVCQNAKDAGITVYTVAFGITNADTLAKLERCATKPPYAYAPGTADELVQAFNAIGASLTELRLTE